MTKGKHVFTLEELRQIAPSMKAGAQALRREEKRLRLQGKIPEARMKNVHASFLEVAVRAARDLSGDPVNYSGRNNR